MPQPSVSADGRDQLSREVFAHVARERIVTGELLEKDPAPAANHMRRSTFDQLRESHPGFYKRDVQSLPYVHHAVNLYVDTAVLDRWLNRSADSQVDYFI